MPRTRRGLEGGWRAGSRRSHPLHPSGQERERAPTGERGARSACPKYPVQTSPDGPGELVRRGHGAHGGNAGTHLQRIRRGGRGRTPDTAGRGGLSPCTLLLVACLAYDCRSRRGPGPGGSWWVLARFWQPARWICFMQHRSRESGSPAATRKKNKNKDRKKFPCERIARCSGFQKFPSIAFKMCHLKF